MVRHARVVGFLQVFVRVNYIRVMCSLMMSHPGYMFFVFSFKFVKDQSVLILVCSSTERSVLDQYGFDYSDPI